MNKGQIKLYDIKSGIASTFNIGETLNKATSVLEVETANGSTRLELTKHELRLLAVDILLNQ